jgi:hypothetical protein
LVASSEVSDKELCGDGDVFVWVLRGGWQVLATTFSALMRSSAARAAHREQARSYIRFVPVIPEALAHAPFRARLNIASYKQGGRVRWYRYYWPETNVGASLLAMRRAGGA